MGLAIRIGTRESELALWQAQQVWNYFQKMGRPAELVPIKSQGDIDLHTPLYEMGIQGVFTKSLDSALLQKRIDLAVHSLKDVPTSLPLGLTLAAVLERGSALDVLVYKGGQPFLESLGYVDGNWETSVAHFVARIATSSMRRKAQWLNRFPGHQIPNLRGNINNRLENLQAQEWDGAIFAQAGLDRIGLRPENCVLLDWMLPAPAQGAIAVVCREDDAHLFEACRTFNDLNTEQCVLQERAFLRGFRGGCSAPVAAWATILNGRMYFKGNLLSVDGREKTVVELDAPLEQAAQIGANAASQLLETGEDLLKKYRPTPWP